MAYVLKQAGPVSQTDPLNGAAGDELKRKKRRLSNRESARRSREKKQKQIEDLQTEVNLLALENNRIREMTKEVSQRYTDMDGQNNVLRAQAMELTDRLRSLNSVLKIAEEVSGLNLDIPEIPENILNSLQIQCR